MTMCQVQYRDLNISPQERMYLSNLKLCDARRLTKGKERAERVRGPKEPGEDDMGNSQ